jgi:hypothetical protein
MAFEPKCPAGQDSTRTRPKTNQQILIPAEETDASRYPVEFVISTVSGRPEHTMSEHMTKRSGTTGETKKQVGNKNNANNALGVETQRPKQIWPPGKAKSSNPTQATKQPHPKPKQENHHETVGEPQKYNPAT